MASEYVPTIGLEIHAELKTRSKMFCGCVNEPDQAAPNEHICPVCMAHPGTLPVINREAVKHVLRVGLAVGGTVADFTEFDRKNYFYPDIPKNYQISQYKYPLISSGAIGPVQITRIHLEEDTARSSHGEDTSNVDFNRAGVPLMELVTEPVIHDAETAVSFARDLRLLLLYLGASDANLEKGEMRVEANVSVAKRGAPFGTKVEVKNLNSFKAVEQSIAYEIARQVRLVDSGGKVVQETRGWDENKQKTFSQRVKEESHDYRYFPDPDLPKLYLSEIEDLDIRRLQAELPMLPWEVRAAYIAKGVQEQTAALLAANIPIRTFYEAVATQLETDAERVTALNYVTSDLQGLMSRPDYDGRPVTLLEPDQFAALVRLIGSGTLSSRGAKDVLATWVRTGGDPASIAKELGVVQISDEGELASTINGIFAKHEHAVTEFKNGKENALQFLVGQCMRATRGAANPETLQRLIRQMLED